MQVTVVECNGLVDRLVPATAHSKSVRDLFNSVPTAVAALGAVVGGIQRGLVATSLSVGVSYEPPMVAFSVLSSSRTWPHLKKARRLGVSILSHEQAGVVGQLAAKTGDRFAGLEVAGTAEGALLLAGATSWMDCSIADVVVAGDHELVVLEVHRVHSSAGAEPLLFHRSDFRRLELAVAAEGVTRGG